MSIYGLEKCKQNIRLKKKDQYVSNKMFILKSYIGD
jgi:hypothetical protein